MFSGIAIFIWNKKLKKINKFIIFPSILNSRMKKALHFKTLHNFENNFTIFAKSLQLFPVKKCLHVNTTLQIFWQSWLHLIFLAWILKQAVIELFAVPQETEKQKSCSMFLWEKNLFMLYTCPSKNDKEWQLYQRYILPRFTQFLTVLTKLNYDSHFTFNYVTFSFHWFLSYITSFDI